MNVGQSPRPSRKGFEKVSQLFKSRVRKDSVSKEEPKDTVESCIQSGDFSALKTLIEQGEDPEGSYPSESVDHYPILQFLFKHHSTNPYTLLAFIKILMPSMITKHITIKDEIEKQCYQLYKNSVLKSKVKEAVNIIFSQTKRNNPTLIRMTTENYVSKYQDKDFIDNALIPKLENMLRQPLPIKFKERIRDALENLQQFDDKWAQYYRKLWAETVHGAKILKPNISMLQISMNPKRALNELFGTKDLSLLQSQLTSYLDVMRDSDGFDQILLMAVELYEKKIIPSRPKINVKNRNVYDFIPTLETRYENYIHPQSPLNTPRPAKTTESFKRTDFSYLVNNNENSPKVPRPQVKPVPGTGSEKRTNFLTPKAL